MASDDQRKKSIERAKDTGLVLAGMGLNAILPGSGSLSLRLGHHIMDLVTAKRLARLEDFHRRVLEGDVSDQEVSDRFRGMEDGDFQHLLTAMLTDIEAEKVGTYSAVYIHLVENNDRMEKFEKHMWVLAVAQLRTEDFDALREVVEHRTDRMCEKDCITRLALVGAVEQELHGDSSEAPLAPSIFPDDKTVYMTTAATWFGMRIASKVIPVATLVK